MTSPWPGTGRPSVSGLISMIPLVIRVRWSPEDEATGAGEDLHARFLRSCVRPEPTREGSLGAWLYGALDEKPEPHD